VRVLRPAFAAPAPEIAPLERPARADALEHGRINQLIESVLEGRRRARVEAAAVAGKTELLNHQRLVQALRHAKLLGNIVARVLFDGRPGAGEVLRIRPAPVLRPDVRVDVIDRW